MKTKVIDVRYNDSQEYVLIGKQPADQQFRLNSKVKIYRYGDEIIDPDTKDCLGYFTIIVGEGIINHVTDKFFQIESSKFIEEYLPMSENDFLKSLSRLGLGGSGHQKTKKISNFKNPKVEDTIESI